MERATQDLLVGAMVSVPWALHKPPTQPKVRVSGSKKNRTPPFASASESLDAGAAGSVLN